MLRIFLAMLLGLFFIFILTQLYALWERRQHALKAHEEVQSLLDEAKDDKEALEGELEYLTNPENFEKELRSRFNYRALGEKFIILVPETSTSTTQ